MLDGGGQPVADVRCAVVGDSAAPDAENTTHIGAAPAGRCDAEHAREHPLSVPAWPARQQF